MQRESDEPSAGRVYLVGAGPGDPRLLTLRGLQCLQRAQYVLYDGLVNPAILDFAPQADKICVGKHGKTPIWQQSAINEELVRLAAQGKTVVRLKGGDPAVFARTAEELESLAANQIAFEVVPGITAGLAVSSYAGIPLTHRDHSSAVALVTGQQSEDAPHGMDWESLAKFPGSLSVYMGVTTSKVWTDQLMAAGKPPDTPAAIVRRCSWSDQQVIYCRLDEVASHLTLHNKMRPPVLVVVGQAAHLGKDWNWFQRQPLLGCGVWLPRAAHQTDALRERLMELGADVIVQPLVRVEPPHDLTELSQAHQLLLQKKLHGITFSSANAVDGLLRFLFNQGTDARLLAGVKLAAVGPSTAQQLERYSLKADIVPDSNFSARGLLAVLGDSIRGENWLMTCTNRSRNTLIDGLQDLGATVFPCFSYQTIANLEAISHWLSSIELRRVHFALITSGSIAELAAEVLGPHTRLVQPIALSHGIAKRLDDLGWPSVAVAQSNTAESLVTEILRLHRKVITE